MGLRQNTDRPGRSQMIRSLTSLTRRSLLRVLAGAGLLGVGAAACSDPLSVTVTGPPRLDPEKPFTKLVFGSCLDQNKAKGAAFFQHMLDQAPDAILMLGDNVYADRRKQDRWVYGPEHLEAAYQTLAANPGFQAWREQVPLLATWDDHDYGLNDAGAEYQYKTDAQRQFLNFWNVPLEDPRRAREGIYTSLTLGPGDRRTQLILLDTRSFRSPLKPTDKRRAKGKERYVPDEDPSKTLLGAAQWAWLEEVVQEPVALRLIATSIQCLPEDHGWEAWRNLPLERARLLTTLARQSNHRTVFLSGDRHFGAFYEAPVGAGMPLLEVTSSSLTHPWATADERDRLQVSRAIGEPNFGVLMIDWEGGLLSLQARNAETGSLLFERVVTLAA